VRVIAGTAKGVRLAPVPAGVRPVSDRAREGLFFSIGGDVPNAEVLDLYAGSGALGIEALSRGAERAVFVERNRAALRTIRENLDRTTLADRAEVVGSEVSTFITGTRDRHRRFDLVLADPPYDLDAKEVQGVLQGLADGWVAATGAIVLTRGSRSFTPVIPVHWLLARRLEYGDTAVLILREA
jgi:16S rRNA (guanine(966)-N(2))-methyltransferase RsmD